MRDDVDYDLLLLAKLTALKAALPILPRESQSLARTLISRFENHISGNKRHALPPPSEIQQSISRLRDALEFERDCHCADAQRRRLNVDKEIARLQPRTEGRPRKQLRVAAQRCDRPSLVTKLH